MREKALNWWYNLSETSKQYYCDVDFTDYKRDYHTLTGVEIENIYKKHENLEF
jgi:hypothetical protein